MKMNVSKLDAIVRIFIAGALGIMYYSGYIHGVFAVVVLVLAAVFFMTGFIGFCPVYHIFRVSTKKAADDKITQNKGDE